MPASTSTKVAFAVCAVLVVMIILKSYTFPYTIRIINLFDVTSKEEQAFGFASYYQDNMVLQAEPNSAIVWGYGELGAIVEVTMNAKKTYQTMVTKTVDGAGVWSVTLDPQPYGTTAVLSAMQKSLREVVSLSTISDILFGDVWICSGQSNMVFPIGHMFNASEELDIVASYSHIRIFTASQVESETPLYDLKGISQNWAVPTKYNVQQFSAVCWLFARNLFDELKRPFGMIQTDWGGTPVEAWSSPRALEACGLNFQDEYFLSYNDIINDVPKDNSVLWNAMVHPFLNMTIKGAIWYQGEANAFYHKDLYNCTFPNMIKDWRHYWYEATDHQTSDNFPFGFVQLSTETIAENGNFPLIRWHQTADYGVAPNSAMPETFMAVAMDLPDPDSPYGSIHPRDKQDVGLRLSSAALKHVYKASDVDEGPFPIENWAVMDTVVLAYSTSLVVQDSEPSNFEICCVDNNCDVSDLSPESMAEWKPAIVSDYGTTTIQLLVVNCPQGVKKVRYAWATMPCEFKKCQIYNEKGLPGPPFVIDITPK